MWHEHVIAAGLFIDWNAAAHSRTAWYPQIEHESVSIIPPGQHYQWPAGATNSPLNCVPLDERVIALEVVAVALQVRGACFAGMRRSVRTTRKRSVSDETTIETKAQANANGSTKRASTA